MKLTALAVVILALGVIVGLALQGTVFEAEAKPPPPEPTGGRTILVTENVTLQGSDHTTGFFDTADCHRFAVLTEGTGSGNFSVNLVVSADGVTALREAPSGFGAMLDPANQATSVTYFHNPASSNIIAPFTAVKLMETSGANPVTITKAWLYCSR